MARDERANTRVIAHTAMVYLIDREGHNVAFFPPGTKCERMQAMVRETLTLREH